jgi:hypothetical protein
MSLTAEGRVWEEGLGGGSATMATLQTLETLVSSRSPMSLKIGFMVLVGLTGQNVSTINTVLCGSYVLRRWT